MPFHPPASQRRPGMRGFWCRSFPPTENLAGRITAAGDRERQASQDRTWQLPARSLITEASLRVELADVGEHGRHLME